MLCTGEMANVYSDVVVEHEKKERSWEHLLTVRVPLKWMFKTQNRRLKFGLVWLRREKGDGLRHQPLDRDICSSGILRSVDW